MGGAQPAEGAAGVGVLGEGCLVVRADRPTPQGCVGKSTATFAASISYATVFSPERTRPSYHWSSSRPAPSFTRLSLHLSFSAQEGISWSAIDFPDNQECLDLIEARRPVAGLLAILDDLCALQNASDDALARKYADALKDRPRFSAPPKQRAASQVRRSF